MPAGTDEMRILYPAASAFLILFASAHAAAQSRDAHAFCMPASPSGESESGGELPEDAEEGMSTYFSEQWKWFRPGLKIAVPDYPALLSVPLISGSNNFFHHLVLIPPLEGREVLEAERFQFMLGVGHSYCTDAQEKPGNRFKAAFTEMRFDLAYGIAKLFELRAGFNLARFSFDRATDVMATQEGIQVFPPDGFNPSMSLGDIKLGLKIDTIFYEKYDIGLSTILTVKIPVGKSDFLTSGRADFAMAFALTYKLTLLGGQLIFFHANAGWAFFDEENVFKRKVYVNSACFYGLSIVVPFGPKIPDNKDDGGLNWAVILQCQGHENAFAKLDQFNSAPTTVHGGLRMLFSGWSVDLGLGFGVTRRASADYVVDFSVARVF